MNNGQAKEFGVASFQKVGYHRERLDAYLREELIFPVCIELDITSQCTRNCPNCPSGKGLNQKSLSLGFVKNLFAAMERQTNGLLLSGGEATYSPIFPEVVALARMEGFEEIAVVTNGSLLNENRVMSALMEHVSTIRISMYDWDGTSCEGIAPTLRRITQLRTRIDQEKSPLKIGISILTEASRIGKLVEVAEAVREAGAHWVYFHPMCTGWENGILQQVDQDGVVPALVEYHSKNRGDFEVFFSAARYDRTSLRFDGYHAAHFLMVIGSDGFNYLGAEVKYQKQFSVADLMGEWRNDFLHAPERLRKIRKINSDNYTALNSRHRGVLYNDYIERVKTGLISVDQQNDSGEDFRFPNIL